MHPIRACAGILLLATLATPHARARPPEPASTTNAHELARRETLRLDVRLPADERATLELTRFRITSDRTRFVIATSATSQRDITFDPDRVVLFRGGVEGRPDSHVFLAVEPHRVTGRIELGPALPTYHISVPVETGEPFELAASAAPPAPMTLDVPGCGTVDTEVDIDQRGLSGGALASLPVRQVELAVDADFEYYLLTEDIDASMAYLVRLYGAITDIYIRDTRATFLLTFVRVFAEPSGLYDAPVPLNDFRAHWQANMADVPRDLAQLVSGRRDLGEGGRASGIGTTCGDRAYSYFGYTLGDFSDISQAGPFVRDVTVGAHELGHVMGAPDTHCLGIDTCNVAGAAPTRGPIMSYCGQSYTGGDANTDARFHRINSNNIINELNMACIGLDCNLNGIDDAQEIADGQLPDTDGDGIADICQDCDGNGVIDRIDIDTDPLLDSNGNGALDSCETDCDADSAPDAYTLETDANGNFVLDTCEADLDANGVSDLLDIGADMTLDLNRNRVLDAFEDCDGNGVPDVMQMSQTRAVWVADKGQGALQRYLWIIGTETRQTDNAALQEPQDVLITPDLRVLVSSKLDDRIVQFSADGMLIGDLVRAGVGGLSKPGGMILSPEGDLLVASAATGAILRYDINDGTPLTPLVASGIPQPFGLTVGPDGLLYVSCGDDQVRRYSLDDGSLDAIFVETETNGGLVDPRGLAFLVSGDLIVASRGTDQVLRYDGTSGAFIEQFNRNGTPTRLTLEQPWGVRVGPLGDVYVSRANDGPAGPGSTTGLHLTNARIYHFDGENGNFLRAYIQGVDSNLNNPTGFAFMPDGGIDCNANLIPDACDVSSGRSEDKNGNGRPDECERPACLLDVTADGQIAIDDLLLYLSWWFRESDLAEVNGDNPADITILDLLTYLDAYLSGNAGSLCP